MITRVRRPPSPEPAPPVHALTLLLATGGRAEIGIGLTGAGLLFMMLGVVMFFDKGLLAMGNVRLSTPLSHRRRVQPRDRAAER